MAAAGGSADDIVKMTVWITDRSLREIMNRHLVVMFPTRIRGRRATP
jgi:enamine deaminase RidA (YjgF/YER057c/UK114 family)